MIKKIVKTILVTAMTAVLFCVPTVTADATQQTTAEERGPLAFDVANFSYEIEDDATQEDMPTGFTLGDWEYNDVAVKAGFTENSDMVCVVGEDIETSSKYRFIYDPEHDMFVPYFGAEIKNGYVYTIPMYDDAEVPYGFVESYFVIQTVPMFTYMRSDAELTQEEIAVGSLSEDNYLVFLMMDENGKEVHYTYDLVDRTFQRALLQKKDAEKVTELNEVIDELHTEISKLNENHAKRMNFRLTLIGILIGLAVILIGVIINLLTKVSVLKDELEDSEEEESVIEAPEEKEDESEIDVVKEPIKRFSKGKPSMKKVDEDEDELIILDLDLEDEE